MNNYVTGELEHSSLRSAGIHSEEMHFVCVSSAETEETEGDGVGPLFVTVTAWKALSKG